MIVQIAYLYFCSSMSKIVGVEKEFDEFTADLEYVEHQQVRQLQAPVYNEEDVEEGYQIGEPEISFNFFRLSFDYPVQDSIDNEQPMFDLYRDGQCTKEITNNEYVEIDIVPDNTPPGDGTGMRNIHVDLVIYPDSIRDAPIITFSEGRAILSFCVRFGLFDFARPGRPVSSRYTYINVAMILTDNVGIVDIIEDRRSQYGVEWYFCDANYTQVEHTPLAQGQATTICITPNNWTRADGIYLRSIDKFVWSRDEYEQRAVDIGQRDGDGGLTSVDCEPGATICLMRSVLIYPFFRSKGTVSGLGDAILQFGSLRTSRRLLQVPLIQRQYHRHLYELGEYVTNTEYNLTVQVDPSLRTFSAEAFECNTGLEEVKRESPLLINQPIRVCIRPDATARANGVFMRSIDSFSFERKGRKQDAIVNGQSVNDEQTLVVCAWGDEICSFRSELRKDYFTTDGTITGEGTATVQYGPDAYRRMKVVLRGLDEEEVLEDPGFAGSSTVQFSVDVAFSKKSRTDAQSLFESSPGHLKALYIIVITVALLIFCCCTIGLGYMYYKKNYNKALAENRALDPSLGAFKDPESYYSDSELDTDSEADSTSDDISDPDEYNKDEPMGPPLGLDPESSNITPGVGLYSRASSLHSTPGPFHSIHGSFHQPRRGPPSRNSSFQQPRPHPGRMPQRASQSMYDPRPRGPGGRGRGYGRGRGRGGRGSGYAGPLNGRGGSRRPPPMSQSMHEPRAVAGRNRQPMRRNKSADGPDLWDGDIPPGPFEPTGAAPKKSALKKKKEKALKAKKEEVHADDDDDSNGEADDSVTHGARDIDEDETIYSVAPKSKKPKNKKAKKETPSVEVDEPSDDDVCLGADEHPGTEQFLKVIRRTIKKAPDEEYGPPIYKKLKKQLPNRKFFVCEDVENSPDEWREATKREMIDIFWTYYEEEKERLHHHD